MPSTAKARASAALWRCSGDGAGRSDCSDAAIRPSWLRPPVAATRAIAWPCSTRDPANSMAVASLSTGIDSPVSSDSSACSPVLLSTWASAGTRSPSCTATRSPATIPALSITCQQPSRSTCARGLASSRSAASARSVLPSWYRPRPRLTATIRHSSSPSSSWPSARYSRAAPTSSRNIGSRALSVTMRRQVRRSVSASVFGPSVAMRCAASAALKPSAVGSAAISAPSAPAPSCGPGAFP